MKQPFKIGDRKTYSIKVAKDDTASFESGEVHAVYSTFAIGRDAEWAARLFVLEMKEEDEEGIGTMLSIDHIAPALVGSNVDIVATVDTLEKNEIICSFEASVNGRLIARGRAGQKILKKEKLNLIFDEL
ncbi:MAG: hypothetical protein IIA45_04140 [Bacteroidetes bacterium]|nr:hypothetical protein [Bacteroidota bacterium]